MNNSKQVIEKYLQLNGIHDINEKNKIIDGFDLFMPVYENRLWPGDKIFQYVRRYSSSNFIETGSWFCLKGALMTSLGIFGGGPEDN